MSWQDTQYINQIGKNDSQVSNLWTKYFSYVATTLFCE